VHSILRTDRVAEDDRGKPVVAIEVSVDEPPKCAATDAICPLRGTRLLAFRNRRRSLERLRAAPSDHVGDLHDVY
jgi:hypothetical protein